MFQKKTVFVVGAGASKEVGLPIGSELTARIAKKVDLHFEFGSRLTKGDKGVFEALVDHFRGNGGNAVMANYLGAGRQIASAMPQSISIDNFLHTHSENERLVFMGKLGIAASILQAERESSIFLDRSQKAMLDFSSIGDSWHNTFCKMLLENVVKSDIEAIFENVAFITFNYDRCIEHYISYWLANYLGVPLAEAQSLTTLLTVLHPYGQVGKLPWQTPNGAGYDFGTAPEWDNLVPIAKQLRTFTERLDENDPVVDHMHSLLLNAEQVVYLGFSYGKMNMELFTVEGAGPPRDAIGTALHMSASNTAAAKAAILQSMTPARTLVRSVETASLTCNQLLNDYWQQISD